ncbi:MAG: hypothetical protein KF760_11230 [Candidatus Eremiobacteraeota bacterium]|nr:hypothetical protein [Candidatus Eremiobacteraeota bacterium]MCW5870626.1 hypothetical protein [Candidatus Eremiobacteraeota bacterium]
MRRAFTLVEVVVAAGLSLLMLGLLAELFLPSLWLYQKEQATSEVHQSALLVRQKLERELVNTCLETMTIYQDGEDWLLSWAAVDDYDPVTRGPLYDQRGEFSLACYRAQQRKLLLGRGKHTGVPLTTFANNSSSAPRLSIKQLHDIFEQSGGGSLTTPLRVLARNIVEFSVTDQSGDADFSNFFPPLRFHVVAQSAVPASSSTGQQPQQRAELECTLTPRVRRW